MCDLCILPMPPTGPRPVSVTLKIGGVSQPVAFILRLDSNWVSIIVKITDEI